MNSLSFRLLFIPAFLLITFSSTAQEFNCTVSVLSPNATESDRSIYQTLQTSLREFINNRKWTNDQYLNQERIECSMTITIGCVPPKVTPNMRANTPICQGVWTKGYKAKMVAVPNMANRITTRSRMW